MNQITNQDFLDLLTSIKNLQNLSVKQSEVLLTLGNKVKEIEDKLQKLEDIVFDAKAMTYERN